MVKVAVLYSDGMEEIEAITPTDILKRAGAEVITFSVSDKTVRGSHNVLITADKLVHELTADFDAIVIPGGMPGATNIAKCIKAIDVIKKMAIDGKRICAICASPAVVLASNNLLDGVRATCYKAPDFITLMQSAIYTTDNVVVDKNFISANGPKSAFEFSLTICKELNLSPKF